MPNDKSKKYIINGREVVVRPLSWLDLLEAPDIILESFESVNSKDGNVSREEIIKALKGQPKRIFNEFFKLSDEDLASMHPELGFQMLCDFVEMNLNENFFNALSHLVRGIKKLSEGINNIIPLK